MTIDGERSDERVTSSRDDDEEAPAAPEYGDLLDTKLLEREADVLEQDDDLVDVGLTLDLDDDDEEDENTYAVDLDVGTLLTSLQPAGADLDSAEPALNDGSLASGALSDVLLPEERPPEERPPEERPPEERLPDGRLPGRAWSEDDEAVGDDEQFPAFDASDALPERPAVDDDGSEGVA